MITIEVARTVTLCRNNKKKPHIKPGRVLYGASIAGATLEQLHSSTDRRKGQIMEERNKLIEGMVIDLMEKGEDEYQRCKFVLFSQTTHSTKLRDFVCKLFAYTDKHRPLLISMNK